jgi:hypothetical protein
MALCLHVIGWTPYEVARRSGERERRVHLMLAVERPIHNSFAAWLEMLVKETLREQPEPKDWRPRPRIGPDGQALHATDPDPEPVIADEDEGM